MIFIEQNRQILHRWDKFETESNKWKKVRPDSVMIIGERRKILVID